jgi:hypothetical protein
MNLTFPMAYDYRHDNKTAALLGAESVAAKTSVWQAGNRPASLFARLSGQS